MTETGNPQSAAQQGNKRKHHQPFVTSYLATNHEESDLPDTVTCVDSSLDCGILFLNPLPPKWNCGIGVKSLEILSEEDDIWVQRKDNAKQHFGGKELNKQVSSKLKKLKLKKKFLTLQTSNRLGMNNLAEMSSTSSEETDFKEKISVKRRSKQPVITTLRLRKLKNQDMNKRSRNSENISDCLDISTSSSEEKDIWGRSNENAEGTLSETGKQIISDKDYKTNPPTDQLTTEKITNVENCVQISADHLEKVGGDAQERIIGETKMAENDKQVISKLKELHVKGNDGVDVSVGKLHKDDVKISRLLETMKKREEIDSDQRPFKCPHCHWAFKKLCYLQSHLTTHSGLKPHVCDICGKAYSHQGTLQQHKRLHTGERPYHCPFCDRSYIWSSDYRKHIRTHTGEKPYECKECGKDFIRSSDLRKHERNMHTNDKPFQCSHCDKTFNRPLSLKRHERKHLGECPYSCPDCGKKFSLQSRMAEHQKIHKGVRPFVCPVCAKSFTKSSNLAEHEAIHSGIRPHKCGDCGVSFAMASRLVRHQHVHNNGTIHSCVSCSRNFSSLANLEQHQQLNCAGRIFVCVQCDKSFRCADKLAQHMQHHSDNDELKIITVITEPSLQLNTSPTL